MASTNPFCLPPQAHMTGNKILQLAMKTYADKKNDTGLTLNDVFDKENATDHNTKAHENIFKRDQPPAVSAPAVPKNQIAPVSDASKLEPRNNLAAPIALTNPIPAHIACANPLAAITLAINKQPCTVAIPDKIDITRIKGQVSVKVPQKVKDELQIQIEQVHALNLILRQRTITIDNEGLLQKITYSLKNKAFAVMPDELVRLTKGFYFYRREAAARNFLAYLSPHKWSRVVESVAKENQLDDYIAYYAVNFALWRSKVIGRPIRLNDRGCGLEDSALASKVDGFLLRDRQCLLDIYSSMLSKEKPSEARLIRSEDQINILSSFAEVFMLDSPALSKQCLAIFASYWKKTPAADRQTGKELCKVLGLLCQSLRENPLRLQLIQLQLDDILTTPQVLDSSHERFMVGPFKHVYDCFVRKATIEYQTAVRELEQLTTLSQQWASFIDDYLKSRLDQPQHSEPGRAEFIIAVLHRLEDITQISSSSLERAMRFVMKHQRSLKKSAAIQLQLSSKTEMPDSFVFRMLKQSLRSMKMANTATEAQLQEDVVGWTDLLCLFDMLIARYVLVEDFNNLERKLTLKYDFNTNPLSQTQGRNWAIIDNLLALHTISAECQPSSYQRQILSKVKNIISKLSKSCNPLPSLKQYNLHVLEQMQDSLPEIVSHLQFVEDVLDNSKEPYACMFKSDFLGSWLQRMQRLLTQSRGQAEVDCLLKWLTSHCRRQRNIDHLSQLMVALQPRIIRSAQSILASRSFSPEYFELIYELHRKLHTTLDSSQSNNSLSKVLESILSTLAEQSHQAVYTLMTVDPKQVNCTHSLLLACHLLSRGSCRSSERYRLLNALTEHTSHFVLAKETVNRHVSAVAAGMAQSEQLVDVCLFAVRSDTYLLLRVVSSGILATLANSMVQAHSDVIKGCIAFIEEYCNEIEKDDREVVVATEQFWQLVRAVAGRLVSGSQVDQQSMKVVLTVLMKALNAVHASLHLQFLNHLFAGGHRLILNRTVGNCSSRSSSDVQIEEQLPRYALYLLAMTIAQSQSKLAQPSKKNVLKVCLTIRLFLLLMAELLTLARNNNWSTSKTRLQQYEIRFYRLLVKVLKGVSAQLTAMDFGQHSQTLLSLLQMASKHGYLAGHAIDFQQVTDLISHRDQPNSDLTCHSQEQFTQRLQQLKQGMTDAKTSVKAVQKYLDSNPAYEVVGLKLETDTIRSLLESKQSRDDFVELAMSFCKRHRRNDEESYRAINGFAKRVLIQPETFSIESNSINIFAITRLARKLRLVNTFLEHHIIFANEVKALRLEPSIQGMLTNASRLLLGWSNPQPTHNQVESALDQAEFETEPIIEDKKVSRLPFRLSYWKVLETNQKLTLCLEILNLVAHLNGLMRGRQDDDSFYKCCLALAGYVEERVVEFVRNSKHFSLSVIDNYLASQGGSRVVAHLEAGFTAEKLASKSSDIFNIILRLQRKLGRESMHLIEQHLAKDRRTAHCK